MGGRLGDILVDLGHISEDDLNAVLNRREQGRLGARLLKSGFITKAQLGEALEQQHHVSFVRLNSKDMHPQVIRLLPEDFARSRMLAPINIKEHQLTLAMAAPDDVTAISECELITGYEVAPVVALQNEIQSVLDFGFDDRLVARQTVVDLQLDEMESEALRIDVVEEDSDDDAAPVVKLVSATLAGAVSAGASDIHLEPHSPEMRVRYRVDGELQQVMTIPKHIEDAVIARIKVMADLDTTESRKPQDGHVSIFESGKKVNFRISSIPTVDGEKIVLRLLDEGSRVFDLDTLGFPDPELEKVCAILDKPHGMVVITGPTGSGKSTTMYGMLTRVNRIEKNIVTVEDPVEYRLPGINQVQSDNEFGMGFANSLKHIMRQDPDVIMVGEIRDRETASVSVQAALTGHLLISTLHTNDAVGAVQRLNDLGIDQFKIGGALLGSVAQRLLRRICPNCKVQVDPNPSLLRRILGDVEAAQTDNPTWIGAGCPECMNTGFRGRLPIFEVMQVTAALAEGIEGGLPHSRLRELAIQEGMTELVVAGVQHAFAGLTTLEEVYFKTSS